MDKVKTALDCVITTGFLMGNLWNGSCDWGAPSSNSPNIIAFWRIAVVIGGFWASITLMPPLLTCGCIIVVMLMCATSFATLASHLTTDIIDPDIKDIVEGANPEAIHALPTLTFHAHDPSISPLTMGSCCICLTNYSNGVQLRKLTCGHTFHIECIDEWLKLRPTCPLCKQDIRRFPTLDAIDECHE